MESNPVFCRRFSGKVVLVTGAASGIGLAAAKRMASEGAKVVIADINPEKLIAAEKEVAASGAPAVWSTPCDVSSEKNVQSVMNGTIERFGQIDVVVNNAGLMVFKPLESHTYEDWQKVLGVDLIGAFFFIRQCFRLMKPGSAIVNVASIHAIETTPLVSSYAAAKAALLSLTRSAAIEGKAKGIRVNAVLPGAIDTPMLWENPNIKSGLEVIHQNEVGKAEDVAATIAFLASSDAAFVQGTGVRADGGRLSTL